MGKAQPAKTVKLVVGLIFKETDLFEKAKKSLVSCFGEIDFESREIAFNFTDYYEEEFGKCLRRVFVSFRKLIRPEKLPSIKIISNKIENKLSLKNKRLVNIDPGYLDLAKLVLASTKDYVHRIYLGKGIYGEVTLYFKNGLFSPGEWTYRDFKTKEYTDVFEQIRGIYAKQSK